MIHSNQYPKEGKKREEVRHMALTRWEPFREMVFLHDAIDRLFEESFIRPARGWLRSELGPTVQMDMYETDDDLVINADLPGLKPEDVDISIIGINIASAAGPIKLLEMR
jgi:HSP20 family protein